MKITMLATSLSLFVAPAFAAPPQVVTDIPVTGSLVQQVLGDLGEVRVLVGAGADPHHFQMRPSDAKAVEEAGLLVWMGPELTPWLERATENLANNAAIELLDVDGTYLQNFGEGKQHTHEDGDGHESHNHDHDHDDHGEDDHSGHGHDHEDHGHEEHADENHGSHEGHDHSGIDPHAWLDPINAQLWLTEIAKELSELDPENAAIYTENAAKAAESITKLENDIDGKLAPFAEENMIVFHDAYGYFTGHFKLKPAIAVSLGDASAPSAARISEIKSRIAESGASCAFPEFGHNSSLIDSVIEGTDTRIGAELDPAGRGFEASAALYQDVLSGMATALVDCLGQKD